MTDQEFAELAGRTEAVARLSLALVAALEDAGIIDGSRFAQKLRQGIRATDASPMHLHVAQRTLGELASALDDARSYRRSPERSGESLDC